MNDDNNGTVIRPYLTFYSGFPPHRQANCAAGENILGTKTLSAFETRHFSKINPLSLRISL